MGQPIKGSLEEDAHRRGRANTKNTSWKRTDAPSIPAGGTGRIERGRKHRAVSVCSSFLSRGRYRPKHKHNVQTFCLSRNAYWGRGCTGNRTYNTTRPLATQGIPLVPDHGGQANVVPFRMRRPPGCAMSPSSLKRSVDD